MGCVLSCKDLDLAKGDRVSVNHTLAMSYFLFIVNVRVIDKLTPIRAMVMDILTVKDTVTLMATAKVTVMLKVMVMATAKVTVMLKVMVTVMVMAMATVTVMLMAITITTTTTRSTESDRGAGSAITPTPLTADMLRTAPTREVMATTAELEPGPRKRSDAELSNLSLSSLTI